MSYDLENGEHGAICFSCPCGSTDQHVLNRVEGCIVNPTLYPVQGLHASAHRHKLSNYA